VHAKAQIEHGGPVLSIVLDGLFEVGDCCVAVLARFRILHNGIMEKVISYL